LKSSGCSNRQAIPTDSNTVVRMTWRKLAPAVALAATLVGGCYSSNVLLRPPLNGGGVIKAVPVRGPAITAPWTL
jgi:hypothetical protein